MAVNEKVMNEKKESGFTLIELLTVASILVVTAVIATGTFIGTGRQTGEQLAYVEMQNIVKAIRQFKQDTGYYPKTGPFDLAPAPPPPAPPIGGIGIVTAAELPTEAGTTPEARAAWFYSPANFHQLLSAVSPLPATHLLAGWNPETGRGWRGPYITGHADGFLTIGDQINDWSAAGNIGGNPTLGAAIPDVRGIADFFEYRPVNVGGNRMLGWITNVGPTGQPRGVFGRPYLVFNWDTSPVLVSMGPDGVYNTVDDIVLRVE